MMPSRVFKHTWSLMSILTNTSNFAYELLGMDAHEAASQSNTYMQLHAGIYQCKRESINSHQPSSIAFSFPWDRADN